jgi:hypothetical protein
MPVLQPHHLELLRALASRRSPVPLHELDGRRLRPLRTHKLVSVAREYVTLTDAGRRYANQPGVPRETNPSQSSPAPVRLSESQEETLRGLLRQTGPVPAAHLDGRVVRALKVRGLVEEKAEWVSPTAEGQTYFETHVRHERRRRQRSNGAPGSARAEVLLRAVEQLEAALPKDAELMLGEMPAYADDVLAGLRRFAREMKSRGDD